MAAFASAFQSVDAATQIQRNVRERGGTERGGNERDGNERGALHVRIGVAAGEPVTEQDDLFGAAVQQAARLCAQARPDGIVVSSGVHDLCRGKGIRFLARGTIVLKGFDDPIAHFEVHWGD